MNINLGVLTSKCTCPHCHKPQELYPDDKIKVCKYCNKEFSIPTINFSKNNNKVYYEDIEDELKEFYQAMTMNTANLNYDKIDISAFDKTRKEIIHRTIMNIINLYKI